MSREDPLFVFQPEDFVYTESDEDFIDAGGFGEVFRARFAADKSHLLPDYHKEYLALKLVTGSRMNERCRKSLEKEAAVLHRIPVHRNIVTFLGVLLHPKRFALILEFMDGGSLAELLKDPPEYPWSERLAACRQIACGMKHLHSLPVPVVHMDLSSANVLTETTTSTRTYKIADFGLSKIKNISSSNVGSHSGYCGTMRFIAPERLTGACIDVRGFPSTAKVDVYSFGIIMYHVKECHLPYGDEIDQVIVANVRDGVTPHLSATSCPSGYNELMTKCYHKEADSRPKFQDLCVALDNLHFDSLGSCEASSEDTLNRSACNSDFDSDRQEKQSLIARVEQLRIQDSVKDAQLREERARFDEVNRIRAAAEANCQLALEARAAAERDTQRLERQLENLRGSRDSLQQQLDPFLIMCAIPLDEVKIDMRRKKLGGGSYGEVRLALWQDVAVAVKQFYQVLMEGHTRRLYEQELSVCCSIHHSNIVRVHGFTMTEGRPLLMVMELLEGSLEDLIVAARKSGRYLSEREQVDVAMGTVSGINHLHGLRPSPYIHGDVRTSNVMVSRNMTAKVGDLGASHMLDSSLSAGPLSPNYMPPERAAYCQAHSTLASDVYSLGLTLCEIFIGEAAVKARRHDQLEAIMDADLQDLCLRMCSVRVSKRPTARPVVATLSEKQKSPGYNSCPPRRMVVGKSESDDVRVVDRV